MTTEVDQLRAQNAMLQQLMQQRGVQLAAQTCDAIAFVIAGAKAGDPVSRSIAQKLAHHIHDLDEFRTGIVVPELRVQGG